MSMNTSGRSLCDARTLRRKRSLIGAHFHVGKFFKALKFKQLLTSMCFVYFLILNGPLLER